MIKNQLFMFFAAEAVIYFPQCMSRYLWKQSFDNECSCTDGVLWHINARNAPIVTNLGCVEGNPWWRYVKQIKVGFDAM